MTEKIAPTKRKWAVRPMPLGIVKVPPMASVSYREIDPLLEPLNLADEVRLKLCSSVRTIMSKYLGQKMSSQTHDDHAASRKALPSIAKHAGALAKQLDSIKPDVLVALDDLRADTPDLRQSSRSHFDFLHLPDQLHDLAHVAALAVDAIKPNARQRPVRTDLEEAVNALVDAIHKATGQAPRRSRSQGSVPTRRLVGEEGAFLLSLFQHFDDTVTEQMLVGILAKRKAGTLTKPGKPVRT